MINYIHYLLHKPEKGWDPISKDYAQKYANASPIHTSLLEDFDRFVGPLKGKSILDLGAGPGQYSIEFVKRGAEVTWHDVSKNYQTIAKEKAAKNHVQIQHFILNYMDDIYGSFDIIFNRVCWFYCIHDDSFAKKIIEALLPHGKAYIVLHNEDFYTEKKAGMSFLQQTRLKFSYYLNDLTGIKIGHPHMSKRRIESIFKKYPLAKLEVNHDNKGSSIIKIEK